MNALPNDRPFYLLNEDKNHCKPCTITASKECYRIYYYTHGPKGLFPLPSIPLIAQTLDGCTASSLHEARFGARLLSGHHHAYSPAYSPRDFPEWTEYSQTFTANSLQQVAFLQNLPTQKSLEIGLRINPLQHKALIHYMIHHPLFKTRGLAKHLKNKWPKGVNGLHVHNLCENDSHSLERTIQFLRTRCPVCVRSMSMDKPWGWPYDKST